MSLLKVLLLVLLITIAAASNTPGCLTSAFVKDYTDKYWEAIDSSKRVQAAIGLTVLAWLSSVALIGITFGLHRQFEYLLKKLRNRKLRHHDMLLNPAERRI